MRTYCLPWHRRLAATAHQRERVGVLDGVDLDVLAASSPEGVRGHMRFLIKTCGGRGRHAVGSGNSIPSYVSVFNHLAMIDKAADQLF